MKIYHNPRCSESRQTLQLLKDNGVEPEIVLYLENNPSADELKAILKKLNKKPIEIIRRGEAIFKENFKGKTLSDEEWIAAMVKFPKLIERPIVVTADSAALGRPPENVLELL